MTACGASSWQTGPCGLPHVSLSDCLSRYHGEPLLHNAHYGQRIEIFVWAGRLPITWHYVNFAPLYQNIFSHPPPQEKRPQPTNMVLVSFASPFSRERLPDVPLQAHTKIFPPSSPEEDQEKYFFTQNLFCITVCITGIFA